MSVINDTVDVVVRQDPKFCSKTSWIQLGFGLWVNVAIVSIGLVFGFSAVLIPQLTSPNAEISATITEQAWITSVVTLSSPLGCLLCGMILDRLGRRTSMVISEIPMCVGWLYTGFAGSPMHIIIGRVISGIGVGMATGSPRVYTTEITLPNMRGVIGAFPNVAQSVGLTLQAGMGTVLDWKTTCYICGAFSAGLMVLNLFLPETPYFMLMKEDDLEVAETALRKFRSKSYDVGPEIQDLKEFKTENDIRRLPFKETCKALFTVTSCKPFWIMMSYMIIGQLSGITVVMFWSVEMLQDSRSSVNPNTGNVMMATTRLFCGIGTSILLFRVGRRPLALISSLGVGAVCITLGSFIVSYHYLSVVPILCFILYVVFATIGYYTLFMLVMYELYPLQVRGMLGGISMALLNLSAFGANQAFPYLRILIGFPYTMISYGICSLLGTFIIYFYFPETQKLTLQEIEEYFRARRSTLIPTNEIVNAQRKSLSVVPSDILGRPSRVSFSRERHSVMDLQKRSKTVSLEPLSETPEEHAESKEKADKEKKPLKFFEKDPK